MTAHAGEGRPGKPAGRADRGEGRGLRVEVSGFSPPTPEVGDQPADREELPHLLSTTKGRYDLRSGIARLLKPADGGRGPATCGCGFAAYNTDAVSVHLSGPEGKRKASVSGVYRCDSISACPVCTVRRAREVEERLKEAATACLDIGGSVWALTITVQRKKDQSLKAMHTGASTALRKARQGALWVKHSVAAGFLGLSMTVECPWSPVTGFGEHFHVLAFFDHCDRFRAEAHCELLITRYLAKLDKIGLVGTRAAQEVHMCADTDSAAKYAAKAAAELANGWVKEGRKKGSTSVHPFAVAARASIKDLRGNPLVVPGLERVTPDRAAGIFCEYASVFTGIRQGLISPALAAKLGLRAEDNEMLETPEQQFEDEKPVIGTLRSGLWNKLVAQAMAGTFMHKVETEITIDIKTGQVTGWTELIAWAGEITGDTQARESFEAGLYGEDSRGPTVEEMAAWKPIYRPPVRVTAGQVWAEAATACGRYMRPDLIMNYVAAAIERMRVQIEQTGREVIMPTEADVWASVLERQAA
ncbi:hypothetical protein [Devosia sp. A369]